MLSESFDEYQANAHWLTYGYHKIAYWDSLATPNQKGSAENVTQLAECASVDKTKPTLIFLHGFPSASWDWHYQWAALKQDYRCIAFDMLGLGLSDKPTKHRYFVLEQADIALFMCQNLGIKEAHIVAHDYGVSVAQHLLSKHYQNTSSLRVASICFLNGGLFAEAHCPLATQRLLHSAVGPLLARCMNKPTLKRSLTKIFGKQSPPVAHEVDILWRLLMYKQGRRVLPKLLDYLDDRKLYRDHWVNSMQKSNIPLGFINGVQDPVSGKHMLKRFNQILPQFPSKALDVGHYPQLEAKEEVTALLKQFLTTRQFE